MIILYGSSLKLIYAISIKFIIIEFSKSMEKESPPKNEVRVTMKTRVASYEIRLQQTRERRRKAPKCLLMVAGRAIAKFIPRSMLIMG